MAYSCSDPILSPISVRKNNKSDNSKKQLNKFMENITTGSR